MFGLKPCLSKYAEDLPQMLAIGLHITIIYRQNRTTTRVHGMGIG